MAVWRALKQLFSEKLWAVTVVLIVMWVSECAVRGGRHAFAAGTYICCFLATTVPCTLCCYLTTLSMVCMVVADMEVTQAGLQNCYTCKAPVVTVFWFSCWCYLSAHPVMCTLCFYCSCVCCRWSQLSSTMGW